MSVAGFLLFVCLFVVVGFLCLFWWVVLFCFVFVFSGGGSGLGFFVGGFFWGGMSGLGFGELSSSSLLLSSSSLSLLLLLNIYY